MNKEKELESIYPKSKNFLGKVLVVGDLMLDAYTFGKASRISPEASVPVVLVEREEVRPGGAGNVMLNLYSLGLDVVALGRVGESSDCLSLKQELQNEGIDTSGIVTEKGYQVPKKSRILAGQQQIVRIDKEMTPAISKESEELILKRLPSLLDGVEVVLVSDYGKGFCEESFLEKLFSLVNSYSIPIVVDPKGLDFSKYQGATFIKPNLKEAYEAVNCEETASLEFVASALLKATKVEHLMITRSSQGISLFDKEENREDFPVRVREVNDVTGAGDTVLAIMAFSLIQKFTTKQMAILSNIGASIAVERTGCARVNLSDLSTALLAHKHDFSFFEKHKMFFLQHALSEKDVVLALIDEAKMSNFNAIAKVFALKEKEPNTEILVVVRDSEPDPKFMKFLSLLQGREFSFIESFNKVSIKNWLHPKKIVQIDQVPESSFLS